MDTKKASPEETAVFQPYDSFDDLSGPCPLASNLRSKS